MKPKVALMLPAPLFRKLFSARDAARLNDRYEVAVNQAEKNLTAEEAAGLVGEADAVVTSWGSPKFGGALLAAASRLRLLIHAAGSVKPFVSEELFARGVRVSSSASAIAEDVAITTLGCIICGLKDAFRISRRLISGG